MRTLLKTLTGLLLLIIILIIGVCAFSYHADIPYETIKAKYSYPDSKHIELMGMPVHYRIRGAGENLVLFHGTGSSLHTWDELVERLEDQYRIITLDLPGFGLTGPNPEDVYSIAFYNKFLDSFFETIKLDSFYLGGNSFGGHLAWEYGLHQPDKVKKLILFDASGYPYKEEESVPIGFRLAANPVTAPLLEKITPRKVVGNTAKAAYSVSSALTPEKIDRYFDMLLRAGNRKAMHGRLLGVRNDNVAAIKNIKQPTLIIWGAEDKVVPARTAQLFKRDIADAKLIVYPAVGHIPMEEVPDKVALALKSFLAVPVVEELSSEL